MDTETLVAVLSALEYVADDMTDSYDTMQTAKEKARTALALFRKEAE